MIENVGVSRETVLLVEDHDQFRAYIRDLVSQQHDLQVLGEAADGLTAVEKCVELQPGLVLLDIGLPKLDGIQVARRIRQLVPDCRIAFLTQESSTEFVQEALSLGAAAYVIKAHTASDLIPALRAARAGRIFVSSGVGNLPSFTPAKSNSGSRRAVSASGYGHQVHFYGDEASFLQDFASHVEGVLNSGQAFLALLSPIQSEELVALLQSRGMDARQAVDGGRLVLLDAVQITAQYVVDDRVDSERTWNGCVEIIEALKRRNPDLAFCAGGAWAPRLLAQGKVQAALQIERIWDKLSRLYGFDVFCGYVIENPQHAQANPVYRQICAEHRLITCH